MAIVTAGTGGTSRSADLDVVRAIALIGVCVMNYHGYLNGWAAADDQSFWGSAFDPWTGPLSTRFAATFVVVAGMGIAMMTRRAEAVGTASAVADLRVTLVRRGVLLLSFGYFFDWIWPGTILFFYGGMFVVAAAIATLRTAWLAVIGAGAAIAAALLSWWRSTGRDLSWLLEGSSESTRAPRDLLFDLTVRGTHPLLPWMAFLCAGMVLARHMPSGVVPRLLVAFGGMLAVVAGYALRGVLPGAEVVRSTFPGDRGMLYVLTTLGTSVTAVVAIGAAARATAGSAVTRALAVTGRCTLTLYVLHALVFNSAVGVLDVVERQSGLGTALGLAAGFWVVAVVAAAQWSRLARIGPLEWLYRRFSDPVAPRLVDR